MSAAATSRVRGRSGHVSAVDSQFDSATDRRPIGDRQDRPGGLVERDITGPNLSDELDLIAIERQHSVPTLRQRARGACTIAASATFPTATLGSYSSSLPPFSSKAISKLATELAGPDSVANGKVTVHGVLKLSGFSAKSTV